MTNSKTLPRIDTILKHIQTIKNDVGNKTLEEFQKSDLLVRATCFSLVQIGEHMARLEEKIGSDYPNLPWRKAKNMRNLIVHVYNHVKGEIIYNTIQNDLDELENEITLVKNELENN